MASPRVRKVRLTLDEDILADLERLAGGPHKRGAYVSKLVRQEVQRHASDPPHLTATETQRLIDHYTAYLRWLEAQGH